MHKHDAIANEIPSSDANNNKNGVHHHHHKSADTSRSSLAAAAATSAECAVNSPLRVALAEKSSGSGGASVVISSLASPLLTASLNSPPVASISLSSNGSVDLSNNAGPPTNGGVSSHASIRKRILQAASAEAAAAVAVVSAGGGERVSPDRHGSVSPSSSTCNKEMYANLLMQLRHQGVVPTDGSEQPQPTNVKMSAAARKEKLKSQLAFQCPVCKKRFQRHIAMNAHFQVREIQKEHNVEIS